MTEAVGGWSAKSIAFRLAFPPGDGAAVGVKRPSQTGLSLVHKSPRSCKNLRIVEELTSADSYPGDKNRPKAVLSRNDESFAFRSLPNMGNRFWRDKDDDFRSWNEKYSNLPDPRDTGLLGTVTEYPDSVAVVSDRPAEVEFYPEGSFVKVKRASLYHVQSANKPKVYRRGVVAGFSRKSQSRLMQNLAKVKRSHLPVLITLTYPGEWAKDPAVWKRDRKVFCQRFERRFPAGGFVWKLEPQKRGAPHFHLLAWHSELTPAEFCQALMGWIKQAWFETVASGDERHLWSGTRVEVARSFSAVAKYASKYIAKMVEPGDTWGDPGRWWGVHNKGAVPYADGLVVWLETGQANDLIRWIGRFRRRDKNRLKGRDCISKWAFVESPIVWVDNIDRMAAIKNSVDPLAAKVFA